MKQSRDKCIIKRMNNRIKNILGETQNKSQNNNNFSWINSATTVFQIISFTQNYQYPNTPFTTQITLTTSSYINTAYVIQSNTQIKYYGTITINNGSVISVNFSSGLPIGQYILNLTDINGNIAYGPNLLYIIGFTILNLSITEVSTGTPTGAWSATLSTSNPTITNAYLTLSQNNNEYNSSSIIYLTGYSTTLSTLNLQSVILNYGGYYTLNLVDSGGNIIQSQSQINSLYFLRDAVDYFLPNGGIVENVTIPGNINWYSFKSSTNIG